MLTHGVVILHDNARPDTDVCTQALEEHFNWEFFDHPMLRGVPVPTAWRVLGLQMEERPPAMEVNCEYIG
jgi:hypothetical protein